MKTLAIFSTTRAEYGIFKPLLKELTKQKNINTLLFVGGTHLSDKYGKTIEEITNDNFSITDTFDYLLNDDTEFTITKSMGIESFELARIFRQYKFDAICILGDRYELLPIVTTAIIFRKAIIHIHGGEKTEGAIDEQIRHMITKAAHLHFAACKEYAKNIIKLGEEKNRVFNTGALAVDNMKRLKSIKKEKIFKKLKIDTKQPTIIVTFHPTTLRTKISTQQQITNLFAALHQFNYQVIITAPNIDNNREIIEKIIQRETKRNKNYHYIKSLGEKNFHALLKHCEFIIGNSSSGIIEAPYYKIPSINIGDRQKGRIRHKSIIDTNYDIIAIKKAIKKASSRKFRKQIENMTYKFGEGNTAKKMVEIIKKINFDEKFLTKKLT